MTEKTHPEAFGHDAPPEESRLADGTADSYVTVLTGEAGDAAPIVRRRGPLVTRWIGFSALRRRARERARKQAPNSTLVELKPGFGPSRGSVVA